MIWRVAGFLRIMLRLAAVRRCNLLAATFRARVPVGKWAGRHDGAAVGAHSRQTEAIEQPVQAVHVPIVQFLAPSWREPVPPPADCLLLMTIQRCHVHCCHLFLTFH